MPDCVGCASLSAWALGSLSIGDVMRNPPDQTNVIFLIRMGYAPNGKRVVAKWHPLSDSQQGSQAKGTQLGWRGVRKGLQPKRANREGKGEGKF